MKNPAPYLRKGLFSLLDGAVEYKGSVVPVKGQGGKREVPYMILIGETSIINRSGDKNSFSGRGSQLISIIDEGAGTLLHEHVDAIGEFVMDLIQPAPRQIGISAEGFQIIGLRKESQNYIDERSGSGAYATRLLLRYSFFIHQVNS